MSYSLNNITCTGFTLCTDHGCTFIDSTKCLAEILSTTYKWYFELCLVDVIYIISRWKNFTLINVIDLDCFKKLSFYKMSDTALCHNRDRYCILNTFDHLRITHSWYTACCSDICRNTLQCHNCTCTCCLGDLCLLRCCYIHDNATL